MAKQKSAESEAGEPVVANVSTETKPKESPAQPSETKLSGKILELGDSSIVWRINSGRIELNRIAGTLTAIIPEDLTDIEISNIKTGLETGRVRLTEEMKTTEPIDLQSRDITMMHSVNLFLDEKKLTVFEQNVKKTGSRPFLSQCLEVEERERNRPEYKEILKEKLNSLK